MGVGDEGLHDSKEQNMNTMINIEKEMCFIVLFIYVLVKVFRE